MRHPILTLLVTALAAVLLWFAVVAIAGALLADVLAWCAFASVAIVFGRS